MRFDHLVATAPSHLHELFAIPGERWTSEQRATVIEWLGSDQVISGLRRFVAWRLGKALWPSDADEMLNDFMRALIEDPSILVRYQPSPQVPYARQFAHHILRELNGFTKRQDRSILRQRSFFRLKSHDLLLRKVEFVDSASFSKPFSATALKSFGRLLQLLTANITPRDVVGERPTKAAGDWIECTVLGIARSHRASGQ